LVDAEGLILGRMATKIASLLMGKKKPIYHPAGFFSLLLFLF